MAAIRQGIARMMAADYRWFLLDSMRSGMWTREEQFFRSRRTEDGRAGEEAQGRSRQQDRGGKRRKI